jgi:23S rRNA pseudouridine1911/1915/1917 synthase
MEQQAVPRRWFRTVETDADRTLGDVLPGRCPEVPAGFLNKLLRKGFVQVDGLVGDGRMRLRAGQSVVLNLPPGAFLVAPNPQVPFDVLYEDAHLAVLNKPAGIISEPGIGHKLDTLLNGLVARYGEALDRIGPEYDYGMVHRLDKDTSGIMVVARSAQLHRLLSAQFRRREVQKSYQALVVGEMERDEGRIALALGRRRIGGRMRGLVEQGEDSRPAVTEWRTLKRYQGLTLVEASPRTGRWRQIRLHFEAVGHPVAGDPEHGDAQANQRLAREAGLTRLFLHAGVLSFRHPISGKKLSFSLPLPPELRGVLGKLRTV